MVNVYLNVRDSMGIDKHAGIVECKEVKITSSRPYNSKIHQTVILRHNQKGYMPDISVLHALSVYKTAKDKYNVVLDV